MHISIRTAAALAALVLVVALAIALYPVVTGGGGGLSLTESTDTQSSVPASGPAAPEFVGIVDWENSPPLTLASLRGKVVLVDFWTYSCINCQRTIPFLRQWWDKYKTEGFVIVGVHSPEFDFEKTVDNIRRAIKDYNIAWPVAVDSNMATWNAYSNQYWPAEYLIDKSGRIRHTHFGEGEYDVSERAIQALLAEGGASKSEALASADPGLSTDAEAQTPELYAGSNRGNGTIHLSGSWAVRPEFAEHVAAGSRGQDYAEILYRARRVFLVAGAATVPVTVWVTIDGRDLTQGEAGTAIKFDSSGHSYAVVDHDDLYPLVSLSTFGSHDLRVSPEQSGFRVYTFTFGS
jgi:thiol-disulfide isomerase/thioredoxin